MLRHVLTAFAAAAASLAAPIAPMALAAPAPAAFDSGRITVATEGSGPDVILIPGLTSGPRLWESTAAALPGYRFHFVHVRGFAGAPAGDNAQTPILAPVTEEIARYIREAKLGRPAVIGHSLGGSLGLMLAARHPDTVGRLMVVDMVPFAGVFAGGPMTTPERLKPMVEKMRERSNAKSPEQAAKDREAMIASMVKTEAARALPLADANASDPKVVAQAYDELLLTDLRPELKTIQAPVRVLYVRPPSAPMSDEQTDYFYKLAYADLKGATLTRVPDSWHFIMLDQPERFQQDVKTFLAN